jgi:hypothetical protein
MPRNAPFFYGRPLYQVSQGFGQSAGIKFHVQGADFGGRMLDGLVMFFRNDQAGISDLLDMYAAAVIPGAFLPRAFVI